jgi:lysophospholipase L1-like esterase
VQDNVLDVSPSSRLRTRVAVLGGSLVVFGLAGAALLLVLERDGGDTVELVDNTRELTTLLDERHREEPSPAEKGGAEPREPSVAGSGEPRLVRGRLLKKDAVTFYPVLRRGWRYDEELWIRRARNVDTMLEFEEHPRGRYRFRTNSEGFRMEREIRKTRPDVRVVVVGDSHTAGVCAYRECYAALLEAELVARFPEKSVEVVNAAVGGYNVWNYLLTLEAFLPRGLDVFVVTVYGGNDFHATAQLARYFRRMPAPATGPVSTEGVRRGPTGVVAQELSQVAYFLNNPEDVELALETTSAITVELAALCEQNGIALLGAYLPTASRVQPELFEDALDRPVRLMRVRPAQLDVPDGIGRRWLAFLERRGIPALDLAPVLGGAERNYWLADLHLNVRGHRRVADALLPAVLKLLEP